MSPRSTPYGLMETSMNPPLESARTPATEVGIDRFPRRVINRQHAPGDPAAHDIENRIDYLADRPRSRTTPL